MSSVVKFTCSFCRREVENEPYRGAGAVGWFAECPECEAENLVWLDDEIDEMDTFEKEDIGVFGEEVEDDEPET